MRDLTGKKALVCGGSEGIGLASAQALAALGADVTLLARREATLLAALESLHAYGSQTHGRIVADVNALEPVLEQIRAAGFDMLINNSAGPALRVSIAVGKFHGVMAAVVPTGCLTARMRRSPVGAGIVSP